MILKLHSARFLNGTIKRQLVSKSAQNNTVQLNKKYNLCYKIGVSSNDVRTKTTTC